MNSGNGPSEPRSTRLQQRSDSEVRPRAGSVGGRVMVVDDEDVVRTVLARMLQELGYDVVTVSNGEEALGIFAALSQAIDLVMLDMCMPVGPDGYDTFRGLRSMRDDVRVVLCSGYADSDRIGRALAEGAITFLPKPFDLDQVANVVSRALRKDTNAPPSPKASRPAG